LTRDALGSCTEVYARVEQRLHWLGADRLVDSAANVATTAITQQAATVAGSLGVKARSAMLVDAVYRALVEAVAQAVLQEARRLFARAQQALAATTTDEAGERHLLAGLQLADDDTRCRLLGTLGVSKAAATAASNSLERLSGLRSAILAASLRIGEEQTRMLKAAGVPVTLIPNVVAKLQPPLHPTTADRLAYMSLGLDAVACRAAEGARAMLALVRTAAPAIQRSLDAATALAYFCAARSRVYQARGIGLDGTVFPAIGEGCSLLEAALISESPRIAQEARKPSESVRIAWRIVEALGPQLGDIDASTLGRGVGALLGRMTNGISAPQEGMRNLRAGDLLAMRGAAAVRAQSGVEMTRALVPYGAGLALCSRLSFAHGPPDAGLRLERRRKLIDGFRAAFATPAGMPVPAVDSAQVTRALQTLIESAPLLTAWVPDAPDRAQRLKKVLEKPGLCEALAKTVGPARYRFRNDEMSHDGKWLCVTAWLMENARQLAPAVETITALQKLLHEEGGRLLDAMERALLKQLD
jgi:hypothetical protein